VVAVGCEADNNVSESDEVEAWNTDPISIRLINASDPSDLIKIILSPNPASDEVEVVFTSEYLAKITLFNINGNPVRVLANSASSGDTFPVSDLPAGIYLIEVKTSTGATRTKLIVK